MPVFVTVAVNVSVPPGGTGKGGQFLVTWITAQLVQMTVTVWLQMLVRPLQGLLACQVRVICCGHPLLVTVLRTFTTKLLPVQVTALGGSNVHVLVQLT